MKLITIFIFVISGLYAAAQNKSLLAYYNDINKAEKLIIENKLDSSSLYFERAFLKIAYAFSRHVYNAAVVDSKLGKYTNVYHYLKYLLQLGASFYKIRNESPFKDFFSSKRGFFLISNYKKIKPIYNIQYRKEIEQMLTDDQYFRIKKGSYRVYGDTIKKVDKKNVDELLKLITKKGFPSENKIGVDTNNFLNPLYILIIIHQSSGPMKQYDFSAILKANILKGYVENKAGAYMINRCQGNNIFDLVKIQYVKPIDSTRSLANPNNVTVLESSDWGYFPLSEKELKSINIKRHELYLEGYEDYFKKLFFSLIHSEYALEGSGSNSTLNYAKYDDYLNEKEKLQYQ